MKHQFAIWMILVATAFAGLKPTNPIEVDGKLVVHGHEKKNCSFSIVVKGEGKFLTSSTVDSIGHFDLSFTPNHEKYFDFFYVDSHHPTDTIFLKSYTEFESDLLEVVFYTFKGIMPVDDNDRVICPKCRTSANVKPISGLPGYYYCSQDKIQF